MSENASSVRPPAPAADLSGLQSELGELIVKSLNLELPAAQIDPDASLYGNGLGLDSIDILEVGLAVSKKYGFQLRADGEENERIFQSLRHLAEYIATHRTK